LIKDTGFETLYGGEIVTSCTVAEVEALVAFRDIIGGSLKITVTGMQVHVDGSG
jgi:hypothetical protein